MTATVTTKYNTIAIGDERPGDGELASLRRLYEASFPPAERRDWQGIVTPDDERGPRLLTVCVDGATAGMLTWWDFGDVAYVEHLAVDPRFRGSGIGGHVLDAFIRQVAPRAVVLEVEPSDNGGMADRRIGFYRRHGFEILTREYVQPPYRADLPAVPLYVMTTTATVDTAAVIRMLHTVVYRVEVK